MVPVPNDPGENDKTFDAGIVMLSFGGAFGVERSLAFLSVRPGQTDGVVTVSSVDQSNEQESEKPQISQVYNQNKNSQQSKLNERCTYWHHP